MKMFEERRYLNTLTIWGAKQHDPAMTENIKSVDPMFDRHVYRSFRVFPKPPTSRFLSENAATYLL